MKANALVFSKEAAIRWYRLPRFFSDQYYRCMVWRGTRYCVTTLERMLLLDAQPPPLPRQKTQAIRRRWGRQILPEVYPRSMSDYVGLRDPSKRDKEIAPRLEMIEIAEGYIEEAKRDD